MSDTSGIINRVRFDSAVSTNSADVVVKGFSNNALQGILEAISKTNSVLNDLQSGLDEIQSDNDKRAQADEKRDKEYKKNRVASLASERRSRATNAPIYGEIQRGNIFNKMLREGLMEALSGLTDFLKDNLNKNLKTQQDLAAMMRKANLTTDEKNQVQSIATNMKDIVNAKFDGLNVSNEQIADYIKDLLADGREVSRMSESELAGYIALRSRNTDSKEAYELSKTASEESIRTLTLDKGNYLVSNSISKLVSSLDANTRMGLGGTDEAIAKATDIVKQVEDYAGGVLDSDAVAELSMALLKGQNLNLLAQGDIPEELKRVIAAGGGPNVPIEEFFENLKNIVNETTASVGAFPSYITAFAEAAQNGRDTGKSSRSDDQIRKANEENTPDGKLPSLFEDVFNNTIGKITGPLANTLDKWFGDSVDITKAVDNGFKFVIGLLGSLLLASNGLGGKIIAGIKPLLSGISTLFSGGNMLSLIGGALKGLGSFLLKGVVSVISKIPALAAIGGAVAGVYAAYESFTDTIDRQSSLESAEKDLKDARAQQAELESRLLIAKKSNDSDAITKYSIALAEVNKRVSEAEKNYQEADNKRTAAHETSVNFEKSIRDKNKSLMDERAELRKLQQQAFSIGDMKLSEKFKKQADDLNEEINRNNEKIKTVSKESESFLTTGIASLTRAFGYEFSAEDMMAWSNFKSGVGEFVTEDIPNFFMETIPNALSSAGNFVWDKISSFGKSAYGLLNENFINPIRGFFSEFSTSINENFINPIRGFFNTMGSFIDKNFVQPLKRFFDFKWLPEPVYKFIFDEDYSATDMATDLSGAALDKGKELLDGAASTISKGVDFVQGLWPFADGGVVNQATPAIVGEDGKEAILPLEKPNQLLNVLNKLTASERANILKSILSSNDFSLDNLSNTLIKLSNNAAQFSADNSSLMSSKSVLSDDSSIMNSIWRYIISEFPNVEKFTPIVVIKDRSGDMQSVENIQVAHEARVPAIYGSFIDSIFNSDGLFTSASSVASLSNFISKLIDEDQDTTAEQIESNSLVREYIEAVRAVRSSSSNETKQAAAQFSKTALSLLGNKSSSPEILAALNAVIKYLRDIASSPANKKVISSASRPVSTSY